MTPVHIQGDFSGILAEAVAQLRGASLSGALLILCGWLSLAFGAEHWLLTLATLGWPTLALGSTMFLLVSGSTLLLHASQLLLRPGAVIPQPPPLAQRARRLGRVAGIEIAAAGLLAVLVSAIDNASGGALARSIVAHVMWRDDFAGLSAPGLAWLVAWSTYCLLHTPAASWLWPALSANYPGGTLWATLTLATSAGRRTPWLINAAPGAALILVCLAVLAHAGVAVLALIPLVIWPAIANTASARVSPDD